MDDLSEQLGQLLLTLQVVMAPSEVRPPLLFRRRWLAARERQYQWISTF